jgi:hypothetical protein
MAADKYGVLGQASPAAAVLADAYTVPAGRRAAIRVVVTSRGGPETFRVAVSPLGAAIANEHYIAYNFVLDANDSLTSAPIEVGETDVVRVRSLNGNISFTVDGLEEDIS